MVSEHAKIIAHCIKDVFGQRPKIYHNFDENEQTRIDIAKGEGIPFPNLVSYSTIGLSEHTNWKGDEDSGVQVEFLAVGELKNENILMNLVASASFFVIKDRWFACPDMIFPNIFDLVDIETDMQHVLFVSPMEYEAGFSCFVLDDLTITWLQLIPISDTEYQFAIENDINKLKQKLEQEAVVYTNLSRPCVFKAMTSV